MRYFNYIAIFTVLLMGLPAVAAPISLTTIGHDYTQNFDTLSGTGSGNSISVINGWATSASYDADDGSNPLAAVYSYGRSGQVDRALGLLTTGVTQLIGAEFSNDTGIIIDTLDIQYIGEQWRLAANTLQDSLLFEYSLDATSLVTGSWTPVSALNLLSQVGVPANVVGNSLNGNLTANRTYRAASFPVTIGTQSFWIRWRDVGVSGDDHGLAVDDFQLTPSGTQIVPEPSSVLLFALGGIAMAMVALHAQKRPRTS